MNKGIPIEAVGRFFVILREINASGPMTLTQMRLATGMIHSTIVRMVQTMMVLGLVERLPNSMLYAVTASTLSLSHGFQPPQRLAATAQSTIEELTRTIDWPVAVMTRCGPSMVVGASTHHLTANALGPCPPGAAVPVVHSSSGHAFLANASRDECAGVLKGFRMIEPSSPGLSRLTNGGLLERIRTTGYATYDRNPYVPGKTSAISVPVGPAGEVRGTLTVIFPASAMSMHEALRRYRNDLRESAAAIESKLYEDEYAASAGSVRDAEYLASAGRAAEPFDRVSLNEEDRREHRLFEVT